MTRRSTLSRRRGAVALAIVAALAAGATVASSVLAAAARVPAAAPVAITSPPVEPPFADGADADDGAVPTAAPDPPPEATSTTEAPAPKPRATRPLSDADLVAARQVAADFAVAYASYRYDESPEAAAERVAKWARPELAAELRRNSGAAAGRETLRDLRQVAVATVETVSTQRIDRDAVDLLVVVRQEITSRGATQQLWPSYLTRVTRGRGGWRVASLQP